MKRLSKPQGAIGFPRAAHGRKARKESTVIKLPAELGIEQATGLRETLLKGLAEAKKVTLDASEIQRIHAAALQLFIMFSKDCRDTGREYAWREPTTVLRSAAALLGATTLLSLGQEPDLA